MNTLQQLPDDDAPSYRLYSAGHVAVAALLGAPVGGGVLLALNARRLGRSRDAFLHLLLGVALTVALLAARFHWPGWIVSWGSAALSVVVMWQVAVLSQSKAIRAHVEARGALSTYAVPVMLGVVCRIGFLVVSLLLAFLFWREVSTAMSRTFYGSCDLRGATRGSASAHGPATCFELSGVEDTPASAADARRVCKGTWSTSPCERTGAIGGCRAPSVTEWHYPSRGESTALEVQLVCADEDRKFVTSATPPLGEPARVPGP